MFFNLFLEVSHIILIRTIRIQIGKKYWDSEKLQEKLEKFSYPLLTFIPSLKIVISIDTTCNREKPNFGICTSRSGHVFKWKIDEKCDVTQVFTQQQGNLLKGVDNKTVRM